MVVEGYLETAKNTALKNDELFFPLPMQVRCPTANLIVGVELAKSDYTIKTCQSRLI